VLAHRVHLLDVHPAAQQKVVGALQVREGHAVGRQRAEGRPAPRHQHEKQLVGPRGFGLLHDASGPTHPRLRREGVAAFHHGPHRGGRTRRRKVLRVPLRHDGVPVGHGIAEHLLDGSHHRHSGLSEPDDADSLVVAQRPGRPRVRVGRIEQAVGLYAADGRTEAFASAAVVSRRSGVDTVDCSL